MGRREFRANDHPDERYAGGMAPAGFADPEGRGADAPSADPVDAIVGSVDIEPGDIDEVVYLPKCRGKP